MKKTYIIRGVAAVTVICAALAFQNCSDIGKLHQSSKLELNSIIKPFSLTQTTADFVWSMRTESSVSVSRLEQATRWIDVTGKSISVYPPLMTTPLIVDYNKAAMLEETNTGPLLKFDENSAMSIQPGDYASFLGSAYSVGLYVHGVSLPADAPKSVRLFAFAPVDGSNSGYVGLDVGANSDGTQAVFTAYEYYDASTVAACTSSVPIANLTNGTGLVIRYANDPTHMAIAIDGTMGTCTQTGSPPMMGETTRRLVFHSVDALTLGSFELAEFGMWSKEIPNDWVTAYSHGLQFSFDKYGTSDKSGDASDPGVIVADPGTTTTSPGTSPDPGVTVKFADIKPSFTTCSSSACHGSAASSAAGVLGLSSATAAHGKWVTVGDPDHSTLILALNGSAGYLAMPLGLGKLPPAQLTAIYNWIKQGANP